VTDNGYQRLGEILLAAGDISAEHLEEALRDQTKNHRRLGELLVEQGVVNARQIATALALQFDYDVARMENYPADPDAIACVDEVTARKALIMPLQRTDTDLVCACADPIDTAATDAIEQATDLNVRLLISTPDEILAEIDRRYGSSELAGRRPLPITVGTRFLHYELTHMRWDEPSVAFFEADDTRMLRPVMIAVVRPGEKENEVRRAQRFLEHSMWLARFPHRNILTIHDVGEWEGLRFVVSEALPGETIRERLERERRLSLTGACEMALQICDALRHLHRYQLVYQCLTPGNIALLGGDEVKLSHLDVRVNPREMGDPNETRADDYRYLSPEQLRGEPLDYRSDIFSVGALLYELCVGRPAFQGASIAAVTQVLREAALLASDELPPVLNRIVLRACAKERHARFPDAISLAEELLAHHWPDSGSLRESA